MKNLLRWTCGLIGMLLGGFCHADDVSVAVASNFMGPMALLATEFEKESGHKVIASYGSTGKFYAQIKHGAPFEVLLAADEVTPQKLGVESAALASTQFTYALGKLVLWSAQPGFVDPEAGVLKTEGFRHLAIASPQLAPYGDAAQQTLMALGLHEVLRPKIVMAENIAQAHHFIRSGNAQLGFIALSQVFRNDKIEGSHWIVPSHLYRPIKQDAVVLEKGRNNRAALAFVKYLQGEKARAIIRSYGYETPR